MKCLIYCFSLLLGFVSNTYADTVPIGEYQVEYEMRGSGKHTILLEAGGAAGLSDWQPIYDELTGFARVIRYSRIGNGNSSPVKKNYSSQMYAEETSAFLQALKVEGKVVYVAHSYGAYISRVFAAKYPEKVSALMLIEPASEHDVDIMRSINLAEAEKQIAQIKLDDLNGGMSNQYLDFWAKRPLPDYPDIPDIPVTVIASIKKYDDPSILFFTDEGREKWGELHRDWARTFPQGKAVLTEKSYHYPQFDEPQLVIEEVRQLLNKIKP